MGHIVGVVFSVIVGFIGILLASLALAARRRTGNDKLLFVAAAFSVFFVKAIVAVLGADDLHIIDHDAEEILFSVLDLVVVGLLIAPFLRR